MLNVIAAVYVDASLFLWMLQPLIPVRKYDKYDESSHDPKNVPCSSVLRARYIATERKSFFRHQNKLVSKVALHSCRRDEDSDRAHTVQSVAQNNNDSIHSTSFSRSIPSVAMRLIHPIKFARHVLLFSRQILMVGYGRCLPLKIFVSFHHISLFSSWTFVGC
jgi:hypothetical protein